MPTKNVQVDDTVWSIIVNYLFVELLDPTSCSH